VFQLKCLVLLDFIGFYQRSNSKVQANQLNYTLLFNLNRTLIFQRGLRRGGGRFISLRGSGRSGGHRDASGTASIAR
jgi:hypothetical protein